ncbi:c-type cytochrome [Sphingomonas sp. RS2018]
MDNRGNTIAGWVLAGCVAALGLSIASSMAFKAERPEKMGYPIEGVEEGAGGAAAEAPIAVRLATADVAKGQASFAKCAACHTIAQGGPNGIGPNLYATMGEAIAQGKGGFAFSAALKAKGGTWTFDTMDAWLKSPRKYADGTKMTFAGLGNAEERANVIAYLNSEGSNLPLPAAPAAGEAAPGAGEGSNAAAAVAANATTGATANVQDAATIAPGAPSVDPAAKARAPK